MTVGLGVSRLAFMSWRLSVACLLHTESQLLNNLNSNCVLSFLKLSTGLKLPSNWSLKHQFERKARLCEVRKVGEVDTIRTSENCLSFMNNKTVLFVLHQLAKLSASGQCDFRTQKVSSVNISLWTIKIKREISKALKRLLASSEKEKW